MGDNVEQANENTLKIANFNNASTKYEDLLKKVEIMEEDISNLKKKETEQAETITKLNKEIIILKTKLDDVEKRTSASSNRSLGVLYKFRVGDTLEEKQVKSEETSYGNVPTDGRPYSSPKLDTYDLPTEETSEVGLGKSEETSNVSVPRDGIPYSPPNYGENAEAGSPDDDTTESKDIPSFNKKALPADANTYELEKFEKNAMIIFNHEKVEGYEDRVGTMEDEKALRDTFLKFGFEIYEPGRNLKKVDLFSALKKFSEQDFTDYGCVVIVILTHGSSNGLLLATDEGQRYSERDIISYFKTQTKATLITKPIILIIQACRGEASTEGVEVRNIALRSLIIPKDAKEEFKAYFLPLESDMLVFHSSYPGKPSYRPGQGSWFIQTLCKQVDKLYLTHDLESIFTEVKREVAIDKYSTEHNPVTGENDVFKQMPVVTSTLIRKLYLRKFKDRPPSLLQNSDSIIQNGGETLTDSELQTLNPNHCDCYLDHFHYMKACLRHIVKNHPEDETAKSLLSIAERDCCGIDAEDVKHKLIIINNHIYNHRSFSNTEFHKFIHFFKSNGHFCDTGTGPTKSPFEILKKWDAGTRWSPFAFMFMAGVCAYFVYRYRGPLN
ncbi:caspase domain-containing protein [Phthorimaea operculella]|nr:caspase domain-containing protein [Phthorimaea operculella]